MKKQLVNFSRLLQSPSFARPFTTRNTDGVISTLNTFTKQTVTSSLQPSLHQIWENRLLSKPTQENVSNIEDISTDSNSLTSTISTDANENQKLITIQGWVRSVRSQKRFVFITINDGSNVAGMQVVVEQPHVTEDVLELCKKISIGSSLRVSGSLIHNPRKEEFAPDAYELSATSVEILGSCPLVETDDGLSPYPLQKKSTSLSFLREHPHLRPRTGTYSAIMRIRSAATLALHDYFRLGSYLNVHTPVITPLDCEGAGEMFHVNTDISSHPEAKVPKDTVSTTIDEKDSSFRNFFSSNAYLSVSGQLYAEIGSASVPRVYSFGPTFRAENSHTTRHLAEFWMLEPEIAFADNNSVMNQCELSVKYAISRLMEENIHDLTFLESITEALHLENDISSKGQKSNKSSKSSPPTTSSPTVSLLEKLGNAKNANFGRISYTDAIQLLCEEQEKGNVKFVYPLYWGASLQSEHERYLAEKVYKRPVFITDYPASQKPFYMFLNPTKEEYEQEIGNSIASTSLPATGGIATTLNSFFGGISQDMNQISFSESTERRTVACFDLIVPGVGELCGGSQREHRYEILLQRMKEQKMDLQAYQWYLDLRRFGSTPHGGWGMGFERFVAFATGMENIRDTTLVPRAPNLMQM